MNERTDGGFPVGRGQEAGVEELGAFLARTPRLAIAFSGGCDSSYLLAAALRAGCVVKAYAVRTAFQPAFEIADARRLAVELGTDFELIEADVLAQGEVCANGPDRCYRCKRFIFSTIRDRMTAEGYEVLADGTNASDDPARRPGFRALAELGVTSPLRRAGMTKGAVRSASRALGLFTADKPSFSCLAVHVPRGKRLTQAALDDAAARVGIVDGRRPKPRAALETERLSLREMTQEDFPALCSMLQDPEVMRAYEGPFSDEEAQEWLDRQRARYRDDGIGLWAAVLKETGEMVGQCGLAWQDCAGRRVLEVGYLFRRAFWHRGLATEAARACRDHAFRELGADEVFSIVRDTNAPSLRVAVRNAMAFRLAFTRHYRGVAMPHLAYSITRSEWERLQGR